MKNIQNKDKVKEKSAANSSMSNDRAAEKAAIAAQNAGQSCFISLHLTTPHLTTLHIIKPITYAPSNSVCMCVSLFVRIYDSINPPLFS